MCGNFQTLRVWLMSFVPPALGLGLRLHHPGVSHRSVWSHKFQHLALIHHHQFDTSM